MVVEFQSVRASTEEMYERDFAEENKLYTVPFFHKDDYVGRIAINMRTVVDFFEGRVYLNDNLQTCVYCRTSSDEQIPNLLVSYDDFKKVYELAKNVTIKKVSEII